MFGRNHLHCAVAHALVTYKFPQRPFLFASLAEASRGGSITESDLGDLLRSRIYLNKPTMDFRTDLVGFALEVRREKREFETAVARLVFDLSTAQSQRRALGLENRVVFGGVVVGDTLTVFSSCWTTVRGRF